MKYSIIIPVYNRPEETRELLDSLLEQKYNNFEVVIVEDGSTNVCKGVVDQYSDQLMVSYFYKENEGPGAARNYGAEKADGDCLIFFDSDCLIPEDYLEQVERELLISPVDAFGGPDAAHPSFTPIQKAISYSMTSVFTTGGIRGGKKKLARFYPRSFNMGIFKAVFQKIGGFNNLRFGEDLDFSIRMIREKYIVQFFRQAYVYHKRRTNFRQFFKQVFNSGIARINLHKRHKGTLKLVHFLPAAFILISLLLIGLSFIHFFFLLPLLLFILLVFFDSVFQHKSIKVGGLSVIASFIQLFGYGLGFMNAVGKRILLKQDEFYAYLKNFYN